MALGTRRSFTFFLYLFIVSATFAEVNDLTAPTGWSLVKENDQVVMVPNDMSKGEVFSLTFSPPTPISNANLQQWFKQHLHKDEKLRGKLINDSGLDARDTKSGRVITSTRTFLDASNRSLLHLYFGLVGPDGNAQLVRVTTDPNKRSHSKYAATGINHAFKIINSRTRNSETNSANLEKKIEVSKASKENQKHAKNISSPTKSINKVSPKDIEGVYLRSIFLGGLMGGPTYSYTPHILFHDGTVYKGGLQTAPVDLDIKHSKKTEPDKWGHWKRTRKHTILTWPDGKESKLVPVNFLPCTPAKKNERIK